MGYSWNKGISRGYDEVDDEYDGMGISYNSIIWEYDGDNGITYIFIYIHHIIHMGMYTVMDKTYDIYLVYI